MMALSVDGRTQIEGVPYIQNARLLICVSNLLRLRFILILIVGVAH